MNKLGFDSDKYLEIQSEKIKERIKMFQPLFGKIRTGGKNYGTRIWCI